MDETWRMPCCERPMMSIVNRFVALLVLCCPLAEAQNLDALSAYAAGAYRDAVEITAASTEADDLALAARSVLAEALSRVGSDPEIGELQRAEELARAAVTADERHVEGRMQLAIALSLQARSMSVREAMKSGHGEVARELAEAVIADAPDNHYAHGFMAVWHVEVIRRGGRMGGVVMRASVKKGRAHYQAAAASEPDDASIHWQWARVLTGFNAKKYREEIDAALEAALNATPDDRLEEVMQDRARLLKEKLVSEPRKAVEAYAAMML